MNGFEQSFAAELGGSGAAAAEFLGDSGYGDSIESPALPPRVMAALLANRIEYEIDVCDLFDAQLRGAAPALVDARTPRAYRTGHIPGAIHMTPDLVTRAALRGLPAKPFIAVYGSDAQRLDAVRVSHAIAQLGIAVKIVTGGFAAWVAQGFPVAQPGVAGFRVAAL